MASFVLPKNALRMIARAFTRDMIASELEEADLPIPQDDAEMITAWVAHLAHVFDPSDNPFSRDSLLMGLTSGGIAFLQNNDLLSDALKRSLLLNVLTIDGDALMQSLLSRVLRETPSVANVIESTEIVKIENYINNEHIKIVFIDAYRFDVEELARMVEQLVAGRDYLQFVLFTDVKRFAETYPVLPPVLANCITLDKNVPIKNFKGAVRGAVEAVRNRFPGLLREARHDSKDLVGRIVGDRLRIIEEIGQGGQATIYRADHLLMNRQCAVKVLNEDVMSDPEKAARFVREAKLASAVQHPNIVSVFDFGTDAKGTTFMAMELVDGRPLDDELESRGGTLPVQEVMQYARGIAAGLSALHAMNLVHRDLKPGNVLLHRTADGRTVPKLSDFGFAIGPEAIGGPRLTTEGIVVGTIKYISPEQGQAKPVDHRTDIFSFGMMLYRLLVGDVPFDDPNVAQTLIKRIREPAPPIRKYDPQLKFNDEAEHLLLSMLAKKPENRPDSAMTVISQMEQSLGFTQKF